MEIPKGLIIAQRHLHISPQEAQSMKLQQGQKISIKTEGPRAITFHEVIVRINENYQLDFHIDHDEANAGFIQQGDEAEIII
ncbi:MAG: hypothetical protein GXP45_08125 [bacterium]|nr:hypothetical protein [bacterium]